MWGAGRYDDLERAPLRQGDLRRALGPDGWRVEVLVETGSTNGVLADRARSGEPAGLVVVAESQTAGRGRLDRSWVSPPRAGLTFSVLLRPDLPVARWPWLPLWGGLAVARALRADAGVEAVLKWPNDVLIGGRKVAGLLAVVPEAGALVLGIGLNVTTRRAELPRPDATSLHLENASSTDRALLLRSVLRELTAVLADPVDARAGYQALCSSLGAEVSVHLPGGPVAQGAAEAIDDHGRLVVDGIAYGLGDVVHLRGG